MTIKEKDRLHTQQHREWWEEREGGGERTQTGAQGGMSGDKGGSRGIRGSPQSRLPELGWRQLSVEAEKMKHRLGAGPPRCLASLCSGPVSASASEVLDTPLAPCIAPPAIWCTAQRQRLLSTVSALNRCRLEQAVHFLIDASADDFPKLSGLKCFPFSFLKAKVTFKFAVPVQNPKYLIKYHTGPPETANPQSLAHFIALCESWLYLDYLILTKLYWQDGQLMSRLRWPITSRWTDNAGSVNCSPDSKCVFLLMLGG